MKHEEHKGGREGHEVSITARSSKKYHTVSVRLGHEKEFVHFVPIFVFFVFPSFPASESMKHEEHEGGHEGHETSITAGSEPPRFCRRLQSLRGWSHEQDRDLDEVFA
jgi:hypothetical protein